MAEFHEMLWRDQDSWRAWVKWGTSTVRSTGEEEKKNLIVTRIISIFIVDELVIKQ